MIQPLKRVLDTLQSKLSGRAEQAYKDRDSMRTQEARSYADGEAHAYGVASDDVRNEQAKNDNS